MKQCHLFFAAGAFSQKKYSKNMENIRISRKSCKNMNKCHLFFAAGAFSQRKCSKIMQNMRNSEKS